MQGSGSKTMLFPANHAPASDVCFTQVEGQDILAVREATRWCADYIRSGKVDRVKWNVCGGESGEVMIVNDIFPGSTGDGTGHISLLWPQHE